MATLTKAGNNNNIGDSVAFQESFRNRQVGYSARINRVQGMAEIEDKPKAKKAEAENAPDNSHLREEKTDPKPGDATKAETKPEDKNPADKSAGSTGSVGSSEAEKHDDKKATADKTGKADSTAGAKSLLLDIAPNDWADLKKATLNKTNEVSKALLGFQLFGDQAKEAAPKLDFARAAKESDNLFGTPQDTSVCGKFAADFSNLAKCDSVASLGHIGKDNTSFLSEKFNISGRFCDPFLTGRTAMEGMAIVGFQPALAGAPSAKALSDFFSADKLASSDLSSTFKFDKILSGSMDFLADKGKRFNAFVGENFNVDLSFGLSDRSYDKVVEDLKQEAKLAGHSEGGQAASDAATRYKGNAAVEFVSDKISAGNTTIDARVSDKQAVHDLGWAKSIESRGDADGKKEVTLIGEGTKLKQERDGTRVISTENSPYVVRENLKDGKVLVTDQNGKKIVDFSNKEDARIYFDQTVIEKTRPGEKLQDAYARLQKDHAEDIKGKSITLMDGKGGSLTVQRDGTIVHLDGQGRSETTFKTKDAKGNDQEVTVKVRLTDKGEAIRVFSKNTGVEMDSTDARVADLLKHSQYRVIGGHFMQRQVDALAAATALAKSQSDTTPGTTGSVDKKPTEQGLLPRSDAHHAHAGSGTGSDQVPITGADVKVDSEKFVRVIDDNGRMLVAPGTTISLIDNTVETTEGDKVTVFTPNKETGTLIAETYKIAADGRPDKSAPPSQTITMEKGKNTVQGPDPKDTIVYDTKRGHVKAWNAETTADKAVVHTKEGDIGVNRNGDVNAFDRDGREVYSSHGDSYSYDQGRATADYHERLNEQRTAAERTAVSDASAVMAEVGSFLGRADINIGMVAGLHGRLAAIRALCGSLGIAVPGAVSAAECFVNALEAKAGGDNKIGNELARVNLNTVSLRDAASSLMGGSAEDKARTILHHLNIPFPGDEHLANGDKKTHH